MFWFVELTFRNITNNVNLKIEVSEEDRQKVIDLYSSVHSGDTWILDEVVRTY